MFRIDFALSMWPFFNSTSLIAGVFFCYKCSSIAYTEYLALRLVALDNINIEIYIFFSVCNTSKNFVISLDSRSCFLNIWAGKESVGKSNQSGISLVKQVTSNVKKFKSHLGQ